MGGFMALKMEMLALDFGRPQSLDPFPAEMNFSAILE
jgi:hypothetical protein